VHSLGAFHQRPFLNLAAINQIHSQWRRHADHANISGAGRQHITHMRAVHSLLSDNVVTN
jgi:hypothetical protein